MPDPQNEPLIVYVMRHPGARDRAQSVIAPLNVEDVATVRFAPMSQQDERVRGLLRRLDAIEPADVSVGLEGPIRRRCRRVQVALSAPEGENPTAEKFARDALRRYGRDRVVVVRRVAYPE